jgi:hypothetical protein
MPRPLAMLHAASAGGRAAPQARLPYPATVRSRSTAVNHCVPCRARKLLPDGAATGPSLIRAAWASGATGSPAR